MEQRNAYARRCTRIIQRSTRDRGVSIVFREYRSKRSALMLFLRACNSASPMPPPPLPSSPAGGHFVAGFSRLLILVRQNIPHTSLVLRDEPTGCDIYLVGCLHGSHSSGRDVRDVLEEVRPGAVVLELCESRHKALQQDLDKKAKVSIPLCFCRIVKMRLKFGEGDEAARRAYKGWVRLGAMRCEALRELHHVCSTRGAWRRIVSVDRWVNPPHG